MGFASSWLESGSLFPALIKEAPESDTDIIVVVPAFDEPEIISLLDSLVSCNKPQSRIEILIVINAPGWADNRILTNNLLAIDKIESWKRKNKDHFFRLFSINIGQPSIKNWGVGLARKAGMDEALRRFDLIDKPDGIIVNLDADCLVHENYFRSLEKDFLQKKERRACSIYYEHPLSGIEYPDEVYNSIAQYELHLRYYYQALKFTGFPYAFHTIGSTIAVKALAYVKSGGMNRRMAGEDFYFIQKLVPAGGYFSLNSTTVYPAPRISERVPFGTGPVIGRMVNGGEESYKTYNPLAFKDLNVFFGLVGKTYDCNDKQMHELFTVFPHSLKAFLNEEEWISRIMEIRKNTSGLRSFTKRFFGWFNMFKIVKYLNYAHNSIFEKTDADVAAAELLRFTGEVSILNGTKELLMHYRKLEKGS
jgi:hypothetical protein